MAIRGKLSEFYGEFGGNLGEYIGVFIRCTCLPCDSIFSKNKQYTNANKPSSITTKI